MVIVLILEKVYHNLSYTILLHKGDSKNTHNCIMTNAFFIKKN